MRAFFVLACSLGLALAAGAQAGDTYEAEPPSPLEQLHDAAFGGRLQDVRGKLLLDNSLADEKSSDGWTALHFAAVKGQTSVMRLLIETHAVDIDAVDQQGNTALHKCVFKNQPEAAQLLVDAGADLLQANTRGQNAFDMAGNLKRPLLQSIVEPSSHGQWRLTADKRTVGVVGTLCAIIIVTIKMCDLGSIVLVTH